MGQLGPNLIQTLSDIRQVEQEEQWQQDAPLGDAVKTMSKR